MKCRLCGHSTHHSIGICGPCQSGETSSTPVTTRLVAVWHTNAIVTDVPVDMPLSEVTEYVLSLADAGHVSFVSVEGATEEGRNAATWMKDTAYQTNPLLDSDSASTTQPSRSVARRLERQITRDPQ